MQSNAAIEMGATDCYRLLAGLRHCLCVALVWSGQRKPWAANAIFRSHYCGFNRNHRDSATKIAVDERLERRLHSRSVSSARVATDMNVGNTRNAGAISSELVTGEKGFIHLPWDSHQSGTILVFID